MIGVDSMKRTDAFRAVSRDIARNPNFLTDFGDNDVMRRMSLRNHLICLAVAACTWIAAVAAGADIPANTWITVDDAPGGGTTAGLVYLPEQEGMLLYGRRDGNGADRYWVEIFKVAERKWAEWVPEAGRLAAQNARGSWYTQWKVENGYGMPLLPAYNNCFWSAHQMCYLPDEKKVLYFWGGMTFKYDPATRAFEDMKVPLGEAPPDVMLGAMSWNPVNREAVLFGGGYISAHKAGGRSDVKQERQPGAWTPDRWDRRATWAYSPEKNAWRKLATAPGEVVEAGARLMEAGKELRTFWGATRGVAFEYGDRVLGRKPAELAALVDKLGNELAAFARDAGGKGVGGYAKSQFSDAAGLVEKNVVVELKEAAAALKANDGWKALRSLDAAEKKLVEAQELLAAAPRPRNYSRMVLDPVNQVIVLFGGDGEDRFFADTWLLRLDNGRWERCHTAVHPPEVGSAMVAMDYDAKNKVVVMAHQSAGLWVFDAARREWRKIATAGEFAGKGRGATWMSLEYSVKDDLHVLVNMPPSGGNCPPRRTQLLRLDLKTATAGEAPAGGAEEVWRRQYGAGSDGPADKYNLAWSFLPKTQAEYRQKVAEHKGLLGAVPDNTWTQLPHVYSGFGRAYGSFCYDWDRDEIHLWGGGHSAYMGNEWSQYDLDANLWMESWNPEFPSHPHGSPDGQGWNPQFQHEVGSGHGYYNYSYSGALGRTILWGSVLYDPDRMRYAPERLQLVKDNSSQSLGIRVEMNGVAETYSVSAQHWYGGPFGVWRLDAAALSSARLAGSDSPFGTNDRCKSTFDTKRKRILFYGATNDKDKGGKCNALWAYGIESGKWEKIEPQVEPEGAAAPVIDAWNYCYSSRHDGLLIPTKAATWFYDCGRNVMRRLDCKPVETAAGVVYSPKQDLFYMLDGHGYRQQQVWVLRLKP